MKRHHYFGLLLLTAAAIVACQKENFRVLGDHYEKSGNSGNRFHITCASLSDGTVTIDLRHGGKAPQEFSYAWDGTVLKILNASDESIFRLQAKFHRSQDPA